MKKVLSATKGPGPKRRRKPTPTKPKKKSAATIAREERNKARMTRGTKALKALQLEAQRKAKKAKRGVDKKKQAAVKKKIAAKPAVKRRIQKNKQIADIKEERTKKPRQNIAGREGQAITPKNKNPDAVFTSGDNKIVRGKKSQPNILDNMSPAQKNRANKITALEAKASSGTITKKEQAELKRLDKINEDDFDRANKKAAFSRGEKGRKARLQAPLRRKQGGPTNPISTKGSYGGKKKVAKADWMQGLSPAQIQEILGGPTKDASGVTRHSKKKTKKKKKVVKAKKGTGKKTVYDTSGKPITTRKSASPYKTKQTGIPDPAASMRSSVRSQGKKGGGKVLYRSIGGSMLNGNDLIKAIYSPRPDDY